MTAPHNIFARLGLHGFEPLAPVLLAALVTEEPLLLLGPHGTAKSLLLTRTAAALELSARHYNASLLNFDDLVGFPIPGKDGSLDYAKTPAAIWGAGAVIFDELSRCRPEIQNKLFPIIHERKVQGLPLEGLRYRWAAMNPPLTDEKSPTYIGTEPLDVALADRFAFVVTMPDWSALSEAQQIAVIRATDLPLDPGIGEELRAVIDQVRRVRAAIAEPVEAALADYTRTVCALVAQSDITLSPRRRGIILRNTLAVIAAAAVIAPDLDMARCALLTLRSSLPHLASGEAIDDRKLVACHREAWAAHPCAELREIVLLADPLARFEAAIAAPTIPSRDFSSIVADCLARMRSGERYASAVHLYESNAASRLNVAIADQTARAFKQIMENEEHGLHDGLQRHQEYAEPLGYFRKHGHVIELRDVLFLDPDQPIDLPQQCGAVGPEGKALFREDLVSFITDFRATRARLAGRAA